MNLVTLRDEKGPQGGGGRRRSDRGQADATETATTNGREVTWPADANGQRVCRPTLNIRTAVVYIAVIRQMNSNAGGFLKLSLDRFNGLVLLFRNNKTEYQLILE